MDLLKNRETPEDGIPRRLLADTAEAAVIDMRTDGIACVMREMMTPRPLEAAE